MTPAPEQRFQNFSASTPAPELVIPAPFDIILMIPAPLQLSSELKFAISH